MSTCADRNSAFAHLVLGLSLSAWLIAVALTGLGQEQRPADKRGSQKPKDQTAAKPTSASQPSPTPGGTQEATRKSEDEKKPDEENRQRDPMSTPTFNGLRFRSIGPAFTSGRII